MDVYITTSTIQIPIFETFQKFKQIIKKLLKEKSIDTITYDW